MSHERKMVMGLVKVVVAPDVFASRADETLMDREKVYLGAKQRSGEIYLSGPMADGSFGLVVYDVQSLREAEELVEEQPLVKAGLVAVELSERFAVTYG